MKRRRRKGGVYLFRTLKHPRSSKRENGYVGESFHFHLRKLCHEGKCRHGCKEKPWMSLKPKMYRVIPLPWWLCWKWILLPLETLVILLTWPRYNHAKNLWNPRRVPLWQQRKRRGMQDARERLGS